MLKGKFCLLGWWTHTKNLCQMLKMYSRYNSSDKVLLLIKIHLNFVFYKLVDLVEQRNKHHQAAVQKSVMNEAQFAGMKNSGLYHKISSNEQ